MLVIRTKRNIILIVSEQRSCMVVVAQLRGCLTSEAWLYFNFEGLFRIHRWINSLSPCTFTPTADKCALGNTTLCCGRPNRRIPSAHWQLWVSCYRWAMREEASLVEWRIIAFLWAISKGNGCVISLLPDLAGVQYGVQDSEGALCKLHAMQMKTDKAPIYILLGQL